MGAQSESQQYVEMRLTPFNDLPPRPEHTAKVRAAFERHEVLAIIELISMTQLTRTQVLCAMDALVAEGTVTKEKGSMRFRRAERH